MNSLIKSSNNIFRNVLNKRQIINNRVSYRFYSSSNNYQNFNNNNNNNNNNQNNQNNNNKNYFKDFMAVGIVGGLSLAIPSIAFCVECFEEDDEFITQIKTGFKFPKILSTEYPFNLVNIGSRKLSFINMNVYSIGFYINKDNAKNKLNEHYSNQSKEDFCMNKVEIAQDILDKGIGVTIKIRPTRKVNWGHIYGGFQRSLIIMLLKKYDMPLDEIEVLMNQLKSTLKSTQEISTTESIDFIKNDGLDPSLIILFNNKQVLEIKDKRLANCFFDFYLGDNTKTPEARNQFFENLWSIFNHDQNLKNNIHHTLTNPI
ncbi:hypothetical protein DDB_G0276631 [Dictyostelium discoideum AX4]|uniref:Chalcone isomerase domain-containing protein n=1 Tax=Dictyostelium discoideum TaxID=44689 RepID=Q551D9_DICDI|nr:hypothetical protein DDB_G0276631 [Dictyostelium discoideum AX4]EAL69128.1 hypothetical protein DDB_G0276631 [Dictyostelium discoideum AX4]|eukprot:XP_643054.1 hypothetical protein DDB_G0276631 [Dictyostelium discoideum AX4]